MNNIFALGVDSPHTFLFGVGEYHITKPLLLKFGFNNRCEVAGFDSDHSCILQTSNNTPILIAHDYVCIHDLKLKYSCVQIYVETENKENSITEGIAIAAQRLLMAEIYNLTVHNAAVVLGGLDATLDFTDTAFVNINVRNIRAIGVSGYFYCGKTPTGEFFENSGSTFDNIRMTITPDGVNYRGSCLGFSTFSSNTNMARIGELNIEEGDIQKDVFGLSGLCSLSIDYLHFEDVKFNSYILFARDGTSLKVGTLDFDFQIVFRCYIAILALTGRSFIDIGSIQFLDGDAAPFIESGIEESEVYLYTPENGNDGVCWGQSFFPVHAV